MTDADDLKSRYFQQDRNGSETSDPTVSTAGKGRPARRILRAASLGTAVVAATGIVVWALFPSPARPPKPACGPVAFQGYNLTPQALATLKQCRAEQIFDLAQKHRSEQPQQALILFELSAQANHAPAARAIAEMYDPATWSRDTSPFPKPNEALALRWYRTAETLGETGVRERIAILVKPSGRSDMVR
ncbi:hypothetical protein [Azospirillum rugosum]|uniref:TPR repeat protein n=1 Tax=Azospirillum rugosum TaxID=416170 RepID=A0ABS4SRS6_9PROT|nr:hypothetical protein [Azospirillum rugosum]MBP2295259.1 TPR repeat protein [Azospirillum rugosum]MDQ0528633.1 TPR repeat protein [Azospirillum rugosum]